MDVLDYISDLPFDIKLIIYSKLSGDILKDGELKDMVPETIFKYRYPVTYIKFKNIIRLNKLLKFRNYTTEGFYFWKILLWSELNYDEQKKYIPSLEMYPNHKWGYLPTYMNIISVNMHCMILFYEKFTAVYSYLDKFMNEDIEICLLYDSLKNIPEYMSDVLKYKSSQKIDLTSDFLLDIEIDSFILTYFMILAVPNNLIISADVDVFHEIMDIVRGITYGPNYPATKKYEDYKFIMHKYYDYLKNILKF